MTEEDFKKMYSDVDVNGVRYFTMNKIIKDFIQTKERIAELEKELAISEHDREHNDYELTEVYKNIAELEKENKELKTQVEKMKCCGNCKYYQFQNDAKYYTCIKDGKRNEKNYRSCEFNLEKWEGR